MALLIVFVKRWSPVLAPLYAVLEGLFLGGISALIEYNYPGIVLQAVGLTFGVLFSLLLAYKLRLIRVTKNFRMGVVAATGVGALVYLAGFIGQFFGWQIPYIHESGPVGIGFSVVVVVAGMNLVLDFDFIERGHGRAAKYMEWILRLLSKLRSR
ncbi:MAG: Bax inhibitor-1/YccA family protein [Desulfuromonas sp.]|nr:Bax inhibitor-1/YccA family protein [Desulfuromonas sp.]